MILQVYETIQTTDGWVCGRSFDSVETIGERMKINIPDGQQNIAEAMRYELEKEFGKWSQFGTTCSVRVVVESGEDSIFSISLGREIIHCKCLQVRE